LAFEADGTLWAITDRSQINNQKSQILSINVITGAATLVATTVNQAGYESLAITQPSDCVAAPTAINGDFTTAIPTLNMAGRLSAILVLMLAGMLIIRRRYT
jgi:secreted PhoX family phosphatase